MVTIQFFGSKPHIFIGCVLGNEIEYRPYLGIDHLKLLNEIATK